MTFFRAGSAPDLIYCHINESQDPQVREAKEYMERTWEAYRDYVDPRLPERALTEFHACFWEIYLAAALLRLGLPITREADRRHPKNHGPDIQVGNVQAWIEAKAVEQGNGPDPVPDWCFGEGREVPDDEIKLRLSDALAVKLEAYRKWLEKGVVLDSQPFVIAVNAGVLPYVHAESTIPRIITVLFPFGFEAVPFDLSAQQGGGQVLHVFCPHTKEKRRQGLHLVLRPRRNQGNQRGSLLGRQCCEPTGCARSRIHLCPQSESIVAPAPRLRSHRPRVLGGGHGASD